MRVFSKLAYCTAIFRFATKSRFQQFPNLTIRSLLKIKEGLKTATEIALLFLMASFFSKTRYCTAIFRFATKSRFQQFPNLTIRSLLKIKEGLKQATEMALPVLMRVFYKDSLIHCYFCLKLRAARLLRMHFVAKSHFQQFKS